MCPVWSLVAVGIVGGARGASGQCWENPSCQDSNSESGMMDCIHACRSDLTDETPIIPGEAHSQPPPPPPSELSSSFTSSSPPSKRSYSMEHFRWGKPVGRKRRPVKVYTSNQEESAEAFPGEMRRRGSANESSAAAEAEQKAQEVMEEASEEHQQSSAGSQHKKDGQYKMKHFRWSGPPASKRYGGFMKSWEEGRQKPSVTLLKNIMNKEEQM